MNSNEIPQANAMAWMVHKCLAARSGREVGNE
jgi:hypothetical protein